MGKILDTALKYKEMGFSVIPVQKNKKPYVAWEKYQKEKANMELIKQWWERYPNANVAIVTGEISNLNVIDIDSQEAMDAINDLLPDGLITPVATTPRGGWHYYHVCQNGLGNANGFIAGCDFRGEGGYIVAPPSIGKNGKGYTWMPELNIEDISPAPLPESIIKALTKDKTSEHTNHVNFDLGTRDDSLFHATLSLLKGGMLRQEVESVILNLAATCKPPFSRKEALIKVESAVKRLENKDRNLTQEVRNWIQTNPGTFFTKDIYEELNISKSAKSTVSKILSRLTEEDLIQRAGERAGSFRKIEREAEPIDWRNTKVETFDIRWPLEIESLVKIYPKNIVVLAGEQDAGKTALFLNIVSLNRDKEIYFFSSEMGPGELADRIDIFEGATNGWGKFYAFERSENFADVIKPDAINIIDYLELTDAFYQVAGKIGAIFNKLNKGIAIIGLQMAPGATLGRGGSFSLEKARLYMTIRKNPPDGAILRIEKAKKRARPDVNPNYQECNFKIVNGTKLIPTSDWHFQYKKQEQK